MEKEFVLPEGMVRSPFFESKKYYVTEDDFSFAYVNQFPVTEGHVLVLPKREVITVLDLNDEELKSHWTMTQKLIEQFNIHYKPDGYTLGWNVNGAGGQTVAHAHLHIMPRYHEDNIKRKAPIKGGICRLGVGTLDAFYDNDEVISKEDVQHYLSQKENVLFSNELAVAVKAKHAIIPSHLWISLKDTTKKFEDMTSDDFVSLLDVFKQVTRDLKSEGYNLGWNIGATAGQITETPVLDVIPRIQGDIDYARGGICRALPVSDDYYAAKSVGKDVAIQKWHDVKFRI